MQLIFGGLTVAMVIFFNAICWLEARWPRTTQIVGWFVLGMISGLFFDPLQTSGFGSGQRRPLPRLPTSDRTAELVSS